MNKIWIAGSSGSGKTTLANLLGQKYGIPVYHRDYITWDDGIQMRSEEEQIEIVKDITQKDNWIFEGCRFTASKIDGRLENCDTIIYLNINRLICLYRVVKRYYKQLKGKKAKSDLQEITFQFIKYILLEYPHKVQERQRIFLLARGNGKKVIVLNGKRSVRDFYIKNNLSIE